MEGISFEYPTWYLIFCIAAGLIYALVLYFRDKTFKEHASWFTWLLGAFRFAAVTGLAALLLSPILRSLQTQSQKPVIVIAQDGSESINANWTHTDSASYTTSLLQLSESLSETYEVAHYTFGETVSDTLDFSFQDKKSNISAALRAIDDLYSNQNLGAVILGSDGIYNEGENPVYTEVKLNAPVYTIALGDTTRKKDLVLKRVFHNKIAYLGDQFSIQVDVQAQNAAGSNTNLTVSRIENGQPRVLRQEALTIDRNDFFTTREFILDADRGGVNRYRITLSAISGEQTSGNNSKDIFVDVLEARQKVLILANAPHPDISALKQSLSLGRNNEVTVQYIASFAGGTQDFDMVIFHQLPGKGKDISAVLSQVKSAKMPAWFIVGEQSDFTLTSRAQSLLSITARSQNTNDVEPRLAADFSLFNVDEDVRSGLPTFPPLVAPFGEYIAGANTSTLLYQNIGNVDTDYPLLILGEQDGQRTAVLAATGLWNWRLFDYLDKKNHQRFDEFISQITQYLSVKNDKRRFRVSLAKNIFDENEAIIFDAELYNDSYELINDPSAQMKITDTDGKEYSFTFNPTGNAYRLNAGILPVGSYRYTANVNTGTEALNFGGQFSVQPIQLEQFETTANHDLLRLLSDRFGGEILNPQEVSSIGAKLTERGTVKPVIYQTVNTRAVINLKWIFFLLLGLLSLEWFLRRYFGAY